MKGKAKLVRDFRDGKYVVLARDFFWQRWKPLLDNDGNRIEFETLAEFGEKTKVESFGSIVLRFGRFQGM